MNITDVNIFLFDLVIKATLLMFLSFSVLKILGNGHANLRSLVLSLSVIALLVLPVVSVTLPQWQVPFYPSLQEVSTPESVSNGHDELMQTRSFVSADEAYVFQDEDVVSEVSPESRAGMSDNATYSRIGKTADLETYESFGSSSISFDHIVLGVYALGCLVFLIRLLCVGVKGVLFRKTLTPCDNAHWMARLHELKSRLKIPYTVELAYSDQIQSPTLFGVFRPAIVLPHQMVNFEDVDSVITHELMHVRRWDCFFRMLAGVMNVIYWFHPLAWFLTVRLSEAQEHACDDATIIAVGDSHNYANLLLNVASQYQGQRPTVVGVEMARKPQVFTRVERILSLKGRVSKPVGRMTLSAIGIVFLCVATVLGSMTTSERMTVIDNLPFGGGTLIVDTMDLIPGWTVPRQMRDGRLWWQGNDGLYLQDGDLWAKYTLPDGIVFSNITSFLNARDGSVWFGGRIGNEELIAHFDGTNWRTWGREDFGPYGIGWRMTEDELGGIWTGTRSGLQAEARGAVDRVVGGNGVLHFDGQTWHRYTVADGLIHNRVYDVQADPRGGVWIGTLRGLSHYKDGVWTSHIPDPVPVSGVRNPNPYDGHKVYKMLFDKEGNLWVAHGPHAGRTMSEVRYPVSCFDGQSWTFYDSASGFPMGSTRHLYKGIDGAMWFGSNSRDKALVESRGMVRYKDGMWLRFTRTQGLDADYVHSIVEKPNGEFILGTEKGRQVFTPWLENVGEISGYVTDEETGKPVADMGIWVVVGRSEVHAGTMTDENGFYRVQVMPGSYRVLVASRNAVMPGEVTVDAQAQKQANLVMLNERRIVGKVVDENDEPIKDAVIVLSGDTRLDKRLSSQVLVSDERGRFEGWQVNDASGTFQVAAKGYVQTERVVENVVSEEVAIKLRKATKLIGRVVDQYDRPYQSARLSIVGSSNRFDDVIEVPFQKNTYSDTEGAFELYDVDPQGILLRINHPDVGRVHQFVKPDSEGTTVVFERLELYRVSGRVMGTDGPLSVANVEVYKVNPGAKKTDYGKTLTDKNGYYLIKGLELGPYRIRISHYDDVMMDGVKRNMHKSLFNRSFSVTDQDVTVDFELLGKARLIGVAMYKGEPVVGAQVFAFDLPKDPTQTKLVGQSWSDDDGRFVLEYLPNIKIKLNILKTDMKSERRTFYSKMDTIDMTTRDEWTYQTEVWVSDRSGGHLAVGKMAPDFVAQRLDGSTFKLSDYKGKKPVLIDFWATWCPPCLPEIPYIQRIHRVYGEDLVVVGVSLDRNKKALTDFIKKEQVSYMQVFDLDKAKEIHKDYGGFGIPSVFLIDKDGVIRANRLRGSATEVAVRELLANME